MISLGRRGAALVVLGLAVLGVAGCSAGGGGSAPDAGGDNGVKAPAAEPGADRSVVIEGTMQIVVVDVAKAAEDAVAATTASGGRIDGREESNDGDSRQGSTASVVLRIPAETLDGVLDRLRTLGDVESLRTSTTDVTTTARDLGARISGLQATIARLTSFQRSASSVGDLLSIEKEITTRQTELEGLQSQQTALAERVAFSTITLTLQEKPSPRIAPDSFWSGLGVGWDALLAFFGVLFVVLGVTLPWLLLIAVVLSAVLFLVRLGRRRRAARRPVAQPAGAPAGVAPWAGYPGQSAECPSAPATTMPAAAPVAPEQRDGGVPPAT